MFVGPVTLYLYAAHPAWSWMYLIEPGTIPGLFVLPMTVGQSVAILLAWYVGGILIRTGRQRALAWSALAGVFLALLLAAVGHHRLGSYGSYEDFATGHTLGLMDVKLGYVLIAIVLGTVAAGGYLSLELLRDSRRVRAKN